MELKRGYFITFEGADGCGKTTQAKLLVEWLNKKQLNNIFTFEPGATDLGKSLRQILLHYDKPVANAAESFLYLADRAQHVQGVIKPALLENKIVICDRFVDSTLAYQGFARGEDIEKINFLNKIATSGIAGPGGGSLEKPVGTVWICVQCGEKQVAERCHFPGTRDRVIDRATMTGMLMLIKLLRS